MIPRLIFRDAKKVEERKKRRKTRENVQGKREERKSKVSNKKREREKVKGGRRKIMI